MRRTQKIVLNLSLALVVQSVIAASAAVFTEDLVDADAARANIPKNKARNTVVFLPPEVSEVMKLSRAGVGQDLILSYIQKSPSDYMLTASQIVYLRDLGVSEQVVKAMVEHRATPGRSNGQVTAEANANAPAAPSQIFIPAAPPFPASVNIQTFFQLLSPYGKWMDVPGSGWSWQPSVAVLDKTWRPYANNGDWVWSDAGWYWNSGYSWGWAPFHFGRWSRDARLGWMWHPDLTWAPAWVSWRQSSQYVGWAPLPPGSAFVAEAGWLHNGTSVGRQYAFGLTASDFLLVPYNQLLNRNWQDFKVPASMLNSVFAQTTVTNNFLLTANGRIIDAGVSQNRLQMASGPAWRQITVIDRETGAPPILNGTTMANATPASVTYPQTLSGASPVYVIANNDTGLSSTTTADTTTTTTTSTGTTGTSTDNSDTSTSASGQSTTSSSGQTGTGSSAGQTTTGTSGQNTVGSSGLYGAVAAGQNTATAGNSSQVVTTGSSQATTSSSGNTSTTTTSSGQNLNSYSSVTATPWLTTSSSSASPFTAVSQTTVASQNTSVNSLATVSSTTASRAAAARSPYGPVSASSGGAVAAATGSGSASPFAPVNASGTATTTSGNQALVASSTTTSGGRSLNPFAPVQQPTATALFGNQALVQSSTTDTGTTTTSGTGIASPFVALNSPVAESVPRAATITSGSTINTGSTFPGLPASPTLPAARILPGAPASLSVSPVATALRASGAAISAGRTALSLRR